MTKKLYILIGDLANVTKKSVVSDVCCGTKKNWFITSSTGYQRD